MLSFCVWDFRPKSLNLRHTTLFEAFVTPLNTSGRFSSVFAVSENTQRYENFASEDQNIVKTSKQ